MSIPHRHGGATAPVVPNVLQEHLEEIAFLSIQRRKLLFAPDVPLISFAPHDERIVAHWDGLVTGMPTSIQVALERIEEFDPWEGFAAALVWLELGRAAADEVRDRIVATDPELHGTWREALRRLSASRLAAIFPPDAPAPSDPQVFACLVYAWGWHGLLTEQIAATAALGADPAARHAVARALGWCSGSLPSAMSLLSGLLRDPEEPVRRAATWSVALVEPMSAAELCRRRLRSGAADPFDLRVLGLLGGPQDVELIGSLIMQPPPGGDAACQALGDLGLPAALDVLVAALSQAGQPAAAIFPALETAMGSVQGIGLVDADGVTADPAVVQQAWAAARPPWQNEPRWLRGQPFPWRGPAAEQPMEARWRALILARDVGSDWLRREVPDGFFEDRLREDAVPGE